MTLAGELQLMKRWKLIALAVSLVVLICTGLVLMIGDGFVTVEPDQRGVVSRLGVPVEDGVLEPGTHLKWPLVDRVQKVRLLYRRFEDKSVQAPTKDKALIEADSRVIWRVVDAQKYLMRIGSTEKAESLIRDFIRAELRNSVATIESGDLGGRSATISETIVNQSASVLADRGVEIVELEIRGLE